MLSSDAIVGLLVLLGLGYVLIKAHAEHSRYEEWTELEKAPLEDNDEDN